MSRNAGRIRSYSRSPAGQSYASGRPVDEADCQPFLDCPQRVTEGRRRDTQFDRCLPEASVVGDRQENRKIGRTDTFH